MTRKIILSALLLLLFLNTACAANHVVQSWWVKAKFNTTCPQDQAAKIHWEGKCIILLTEEDLEALPNYVKEDMQEVLAVLRTPFKTVNSSETLYYAVGVFREKNGHAGRALVISYDNNFAHILRVILVHGEAGFSALIKQPTKLLWTFCLQCGEYEVVAERQAGTEHN